MPELPEVETMVRGIRPVFDKSTIENVVLPACERRSILMEPAFEQIQVLSRGQKIVSVDRRAKRILIRLENELTFVIEPRMTGLVLASDPPTREHLRFEWQLKSGRQRKTVWFWDRRGLGTLRLADPLRLEELLGAHRLGPDALLLDQESLSSALVKTSRPVKVALLDQKLIAGIGNLYASEILHRARIHPEIPANALKRKDLAVLLESTLEVLEEAIRYEGSTLSDGTYRNALNQDGSYQNQHRVYDRAGELCPTCHKHAVIRIVQAQRSTFYCEFCQKTTRGR